jgi:catechol 2,3-dioxygenase-like lactoylglutathione lyase family enzyme
MTGPTAAGAAVLGVDNVLFTVGDLDTAVDFYTGQLGLALAFRLDDAGIAMLRLGPETPGLLIRRADASQVTGGGRVWLEVRDTRPVARRSPTCPAAASRSRWPLAGPLRSPTRGATSSASPTTPSCRSADARNGRTQWRRPGDHVWSPTVSHLRECAAGWRWICLRAPRRCRVGVGSGDRVRAAGALVSLLYLAEPHAPGDADDSECPAA